MRIRPPLARQEDIVWPDASEYDRALLDWSHTVYDPDIRNGALFRDASGSSRLPPGLTALQRNAPVAQLDRASDYESEGRTFESFRARHFSTVRSGYTGYAAVIPRFVLECFRCTKGWRCTSAVHRAA